MNGAERKQLIDTCVREAADYYYVTQAAIMSRRKQKSVAAARAMAMALLRPAEVAVFGETGLANNNNLELPRDGVALLVVLWALATSRGWVDTKVVVPPTTVLATAWQQLTPTQLRMASTNRAAALASAVSDAKMT